MTVGEWLAVEASEHPWPLQASEEAPPTNILAAAWEFVRWCAAEDYRGPMPEHVRRARDLLASPDSVKETQQP